MNKNEHPLILVFYLNREMMMNGDIIRAFADSVNNAIAEREANCMAFFLPTDEQERIECISHVPEHLEQDIEKLINDIKTNFS